MKRTRRADLFSALMIMSAIVCSTAAPAMASQMDRNNTVAVLGAVTMHAAPTMQQELVNKKKYQIARISIPARTEDVWTALTTYDRATEIYSNVKELKMIRDDGDRKRIEFNVSSMGGLWKYDYTLDVKEMKAAKRIEWTRHSGAFKTNEGWWQLTPVEGGTHVTYAKFIDGGLLLPQSMVNGELRKIMPDVLTNLRTAVLKEHLASK
jgi:carbon monoxide dehydrogenase subunit G